jgi:hypothetical protein
MLRQARVHWIGGRAFLVGDAVPWNEGDTKKLPIAWFPVDSIQCIAEYSNMDELKEYYRDRMPFAKPAEPGVGGQSQ